MEQQWEEHDLVARDGPRHQLERVPDEGQFQVMLKAASGAPELRDLRRLIHAWQAVAEQCDVATREVMKLAVYRLEVERALGTEIAQTVRRGGHGPKSHDATSKRGGASRGLPEGVTKHQSRRYKALAAIPADVFARYIAKARTGSKPPTSAGAQRFAGSMTVKRPSRRRAQSAGRSRPGLVLPDSALRAVFEVLAVDVVVGDCPMSGAFRRIDPAGGLPVDLSGDVFVSDCRDPAAWLAEFCRLRSARTIGQVIITLEAEVWAEWFRLLEVDGWVCCFLTGLRTAAGAGVLFGYHGEASDVFRHAVAPIGSVC